MTLLGSGATLVVQSEDKKKSEQPTIVITGDNNIFNINNLNLINDNAQNKSYNQAKPIEMEAELTDESDKNSTSNKQNKSLESQDKNNKLINGTKSEPINIPIQEPQKELEKLTEETPKAREN